MASGELRPGDMIASYRVIRKLGEGGMGAVYEAIQDFTQRRAAVKLLHSFRADDEYKARFMQEARALAQQDHPNVVRLLDANITDKGDIWIAMEFLEGCTLREFCARSGPLPVEVALHHLIEICDGIAAGHEIGIVHCDLKPENVFLTKQGATKVVDFGAARAPSLGVIRSTAAVIAAGGQRSVIGTPEYMSPEHLQSQGARERTDIFALGTIGWEMLAGRHWMIRQDGSKPHLWEVVRLQIDTMPPLVSAVAPHVPVDVARIVQRAMEKDPALRWPRVADLAEALHEALARCGGERPDPPGHKSLKKKRPGPGAQGAHSPFSARSAPPSMSAPPSTSAPPSMSAPPRSASAARNAALPAIAASPLNIAPPRAAPRAAVTAPLDLSVPPVAVALEPSFSRPSFPSAPGEAPRAEAAMAPTSRTEELLPPCATVHPPKRARSLSGIAFGLVTGSALGMLVLFLGISQGVAPAASVVDGGPPGADAAAAIATASELGIQEVPPADDAGASTPGSGDSTLDAGIDKDAGSPPQDAGSNGQSTTPKKDPPRASSASVATPPRSPDPRSAPASAASSTPRIDLPFGPKK